MPVAHGGCRFVPEREPHLTPVGARHAVSAVGSDHPLELFHTLESAGRRFRLAVGSDLADDPLNRADRILGAQPDPQVVVHDVVEVGVQAADRRVCLAEEERGGLDHEVRRPEHLLETPRLHGLGGDDHGPVAIDELGAAVEKAGAGVRFQLRHGSVYRAGKIDVVRVEPGDVLARGGRESAMYRIGLAGVGSRRPADAVAVAAQDVDGAVRAAAVHDQILDRGVVLREHGIDRGPDELSLVV